MWARTVHRLSAEQKWHTDHEQSGAPLFFKAALKQMSMMAVSWGEQMVARQIHDFNVGHDSV